MSRMHFPFVRRIPSNRWHRKSRLVQRHFKESYFHLGICPFSWTLWPADSVDVHMPFGSWSSSAVLGFILALFLAPTNGMWVMASRADDSCQVRGCRTLTADVVRFKLHQADHLRSLTWFTSGLNEMVKYLRGYVIKMYWFSNDKYSNEQSF